MSHIPDAIEILKKEIADKEWHINSGTHPDAMIDVLKENNSEVEEVIKVLRGVWKRTP
jgi:hypothetical protein